MSHFFATLRQDLRFAVRYLLANPGFAIVVIAALTLGVGASAAVFNVLYQVLLKPLPYPQANSVFFIHNQFPKSQAAVTGVSGFDYAEIARRKDVFVHSGLFYYNDLTMTGAGDAKHVDAVNASSTLFDTLAVTPEFGRAYTKTEDQRGAPGTAILSDRLWRTVFASDRHVIGRQIYLTGVPYTVIGVMPASFQFPSRETQLWIPTALRPGEFTLEGGRLEKWLHMIVRLAPGVTTTEADAALRDVSMELGRRYPAFYRASDGWKFALRQVGDEQTAKMRRWIFLAFAAVLSVLLIACVNVTALFLARSAARANEIAIRAAIGASASRIIAQLLTETSVLVFVSCGLGLLFSIWLLRMVNIYGPLPLPIVFQARTVGFVLLLTMAGIIVAGLVPALLAAKVPVDRTLRSGATRTVSGGVAFRKLIVAFQVACAVALLFLATQLTRSFLNLSLVPTGFNQARVWTGAVSMIDKKYRSTESWNTSFYQPLLEKLRSLPGVHIASGTNALPFNPSGVWTEEIHFRDGAQISPKPEAQLAVVFPGYFEAMRIPLLRGRTFTEGDRAGSAAVAVIDSELAHRYFPAEDPVDKLIAAGGASPARIIGVVGSVQNSDLGGPNEPELYFPEYQERLAATYLVLRMNGDVDPTGAARLATAKVDPDVALYDTDTMTNRVASSLRLRRSVSWLLDGLAGTGLFLALVGLYGSITHFVQLRYRELGIRAALGASRTELVRMVLAQALGILLIGLGAGAFAAIWAGQAVRNQLFGVEAAEPATWTIVFGLTLIVALVAALVPAARAGRIEPAVALRNE